MHFIKTSTYFHNYSIKNTKVTNMTSQTLNTPVQQMKEKKYSTSLKTTSQHKHTSRNSAVLLSDTMVCVLYIYSTIFIFDIKPM